MSILNFLPESEREFYRKTARFNDYMIDTHILKVECENLIEYLREHMDPWIKRLEDDRQNYLVVESLRKSLKD